MPIIKWDGADHEEPTSGKNKLERDFQIKSERKLDNELYDRFGYINKPSSVAIHRNHLIQNKIVYEYIIMQYQGLCRI